jgi:hypothetical protein
MIKYKPASVILDQVAEELSSYDDQGMIDYGKLYKIIRKCNAILGLKLNPEKQIMLSVKNFKVKLPEDFESLNFAFLCQTKKINVTLPSGFQVEYKDVSSWKQKSCCIWQCETETVIFEKTKEEWQSFSKFDIVRVNSSSMGQCAHQCPNFFSRSQSMISIGQDGWISTNFETGDLYLNYVGSMENEDGDLMVLDHPIVEAYYEAAVTAHIFKLIYRNKEDDVQQLYADAVIEKSRAEKVATSLVNMPEYTEIRDVAQAQRVRHFNKYVLPITGWN